MIRLALKAFGGSGLALVILGLFGLMQPSPTYYAPIKDRFFHADQNCQQAVQDCPAAEFGSYEAAERFGSPCPSCVSKRRITATTSTIQDRPSRPAQIGLGQKQHSE